MKIKQLVEAKYIGEKSFEVFLKKFFVGAEWGEIGLLGDEFENAQIFKLREDLMGLFKDDNFKEMRWRFVVVQEDRGIVYLDLYDDEGDETWNDLPEDVFFRKIGLFEKPKQIYP